MELVEIYEEVKKSFCGLNSFKVRGDVIEISTPFSTLNNKFVSVFIKSQLVNQVLNQTISKFKTIKASKTVTLS